MARRVFFSFHFERHVTRAWVVRNSWCARPNREEAGFWDASPTEVAKKQGEDAVRRLIERGLENTSVTVVLIGAETAQRPWVLYEIKRSHERGNGLLGVRIHGIRNLQQKIDYPGQSPFEKVWIHVPWGRQYLSQVYPVYDWLQTGYDNLGIWVEAAARGAGR